MTILSNDEFAQHVMLLASSEQFRPSAYFDRDGDCIEFLAKPDAFRAERVDDLVTVYYSQESGEVIGSLIKGVSKFCRDMLEKLPGFKIEIHDGPIKLEHIFLAKMWTGAPPQHLATLAYRKLIEVSKETIVEGDFCLAEG